MKIYVSSRVLKPKHSGGIVGYFLGVVEALAAGAGQTDEFHLGLSVHGQEFDRVLPDSIQRHWLAGVDPVIQTENERALLTELKPDWVIYFVADPLNDYGNGGFRVATCIADLQHLHFPHFFPPNDRLARDRAFSDAVGFSDVVYTLSHFCQKDLTRAFGLADHAVQVVTPAPRGPFVDGPASAADVAQARANFKLPASYAIFPGNFWRHKNHARLLEAFGRWWRDRPSKAAGGVPHLVLMGSEVESDAKLQELLRAGQREGWLSLPGFVTDSELHAMLSGARCLVFPSLFEGFGIPILEALALGRPVASSNATSLPEVGGDLPHYFDPTDETAMLAALEGAWTQTVDAEFLARARAQAAHFQYRRSAAALRQALAEVSAPSAPRRAAEYHIVEEQPLVSIVTPSFQHAPFLRQCIESVLSQDYPRIEYAVCDGGSTDGSVEILRSYGTRFHWESGPDGGQTHAINKGLRRANGQILAYLNSDDFLLPGAVSRVVQAWRLQPSVDVFYGKAHWADESGGFTSDYATQPFEAEAFRGDCFICQPACFWRRNAMERFGFFDERFQFAMDYEYWQRILSRGGLICFLDEFLACSRSHQATKTRTQRTRVYKDIFASQWQLWGRMHPSWWLGLLHHLADERKGVWPALIPKKSSGRMRLAGRLSRCIRNPFSRNGGIRRRQQHAGIFPDGSVAPDSWIEVSLKQPTELSLAGTSPMANDVRVLVDGKTLCETQTRAGEPFRLSWHLEGGNHHIQIRSGKSRGRGTDCETAFQLTATNLFLY